MVEEHQGLKDARAAELTAVSTPRGTPRNQGLSPRGDVAAAESTRGSKAQQAGSSFSKRRPSNTSMTSKGGQPDWAIRGPTAKRHCTDFPCLLFSSVYMTLFVYFSIEIFVHSQVAEMENARDHTGSRCNAGNATKTYYPDLGNDYVMDPTLGSLYGICVDRCPNKGDVVPDYGDFRYPVWFASTPTLDVFNRCVPYENDTLLNSSVMCAWPPCNGDKSTTNLTNMTQVCGLEGEESEKYWIQGRPESFFEDGWREERVSEDVIQERMNLWREQEAHSHCEIEVTRGITIKIVDKSKNAIQVLLERYLGLTVRSGLQIYENRYRVLLLGVGMSIAATMTVISTFSFCVRAIVLAMIGLMFTALMGLNYILYRKANWNSGEIGRGVIDIVFGGGGGVGTPGGLPDSRETLENIRDAFLSDVNDTRMLYLFQVGAVLCSVFTALLCCMVCSMKKHIDMLVQLTAEAARLIRQMPALLFFPAFGVILTSAVAVYMMMVVVGVMTLPTDFVQGYVDTFNNSQAIRDFMNETNITILEQPETVRTYMIWWCVFSFLFFYAFSVAIFTTGISGAVAQWYFFRNDPDDPTNSAWGRFFGVPVQKSVWYMFRYHLGTLSFGSFVIAAVAIPRIVLEYIDQQTKAAQASNPMLRCMMCIARCFLWCFHNCIQYMTNMSFINTAVTGKPFCKSAFSVMGLITKYPAQLGMIKVATIGLTLLITLTVPTSMAVLSYFTILQGWFPSMVAIVALSFLVSYMVIDVFDVVILTLFVSFVRDQEKYKAVFAPPGFRVAMGIPEPSEEDIELVQKKTAEKGPGRKS